MLSPKALGSPTNLLPLFLSCRSRTWAPWMLIGCMLATITRTQFWLSVLLLLAGRVERSPAPRPKIARNPWRLLIASCEQDHIGHGLMSTMLYESKKWYRVRGGVTGGSRSQAEWKCMSCPYLSPYKYGVQLRHTLFSLDSKFTSFLNHITIFCGGYSTPSSL